MEQVSNLLARHCLPSSIFYPPSSNFCALGSASQLNSQDSWLNLKTFCLQ